MYVTYPCTVVHVLWCLYCVDNYALSNEQLEHCLVYIASQTLHVYTVEPLYSGHPCMGNKLLAVIQSWPLLRGCFTTP